MCAPQSPRQGKSELSIKKVGKYLIGATIGKGTFSTVHVGLDSHSKRRVAVCRKEEFAKRGMLEDLKCEIECLKGAQSSGVTELIDEFETANNHYIIMELCPATLLEEITNDPHFSDKAQVRFKELIRSIASCHSKGVVHRDIKPENVLVNPEGRLKLADFGFARNTRRSNGKVNIGAGTLEYLAPECHARQRALETDLRNFNFAAADMWSSGIVLYAMLTGKLPFSRQELVSWTPSTRCQPYYPEDLDPEAKDLLSSLLNFNEKARPTAKEVLKHPFLKTSLKTSINNKLHKVIRTFKPIKIKSSA